MRKTLVATLLAASAFSSSASAAVSFDLDVTFSGFTVPGHISATFETIATGQVKLTIDASALSQGNIDDFYFNYGGATPVTSLLFSTLSGDAPNEFLTGWNAFMADGETAGFDIKFDYPPPPGQQSARFLAGETASYLISGAGITEQDFFVTLENYKYGAFYAAAHIQQLGANGGQSGWVAAIPEPQTYALLLAGLGLLGFAARRRKNLISA